MPLHVANWRWCSLTRCQPLAGGSPLVRTCYLKSNLTADPDPDSYLHNSAPLSISKLYPEVRYVDPTWEIPGEVHRFSSSLFTPFWL